MIYSCRKTINANGRYMYYVHPISHMGRGTPHSPESSVKDSVWHKKIREQSEDLRGEVVVFPELQTTSR